MIDVVMLYAVRFIWRVIIHVWGYWGGAIIFFRRFYRGER